MKLIPPIIAIFLSITCTAQQPFEDHIYQLVNGRTFKHLDDKVSSRFYLRKSTSPTSGPWFSQETLSSFTDYLSGEDISFMLQQNDTNYMDWDQAKLDKATVLDKAALQQVNPKGFYLIEKPLFTENMNYAVMKVGYHCGNVCYESCYYLYHRNGETWQKVAEKHCFMS